MRRSYTSPKDVGADNGKKYAKMIFCSKFYKRTYIIIAWEVWVLRNRFTTKPEALITHP
jgi:hypothetical protein